jgi:MFS family permease
MRPATALRTSFWSRHFLAVEAAVALALPTGFAVWVEWTKNYGMIADVLDKNRGAVYGTLASVFGALLGFVITTLSIVAGFASRLVPMRKSPYYDQLWRVFTSATWSLGIATIIAAAALLLDRDAHQLRWVVYVVMWWSLMGVDRVFRCVWVLEKVVLFVVHEPPERPATTECRYTPEPERPPKGQ